MAKKTHRGRPRIYKEGQKKRVLLQMPSDLAVRLDKYAAANDTNRTAVIHQALREFLDDNRH
jgi:predicted transcriptional regulator